LPAAGYEEYSFAGQFDRNLLEEMNGLVNAVETQTLSCDLSGDMFISELPADAAIQPLVQRLAEALQDPCAEAQSIKQACQDIVSTMTGRQFANADPAVLLNILKWGMESWCLGRGGSGAPPLATFQAVLAALSQALYGRLAPDLVRRADRRRPQLGHIVEVLATLPSLEREVDYLRGVVASAEVRPVVTLSE
jgi:hypothetical protein